MKWELKLHYDIGIRIESSLYSWVNLESELNQRALIPNQNWIGRNFSQNCTSLMGLCGWLRLFVRTCCFIVWPCWFLCCKSVVQSVILCGNKILLSPDSSDASWSPWAILKLDGHYDNCSTSRGNHTHVTHILNNCQDKDKTENMVSKNGPV